MSANFICYRGDLLSNLSYFISGDRDHFNITKTLYVEKYVKKRKKFKL